MHQPLSRPNSSNLNDLYPGRPDFPPEAFRPDSRPLRHPRPHSHNPSPQLQPQYDADDGYATPADPRSSRQSRPSSQYLPTPPPPPPQHQYSPQMQPQYIEDDGTASEQPLYKPAPGPPRSIATQSVRAHSPPPPGPILDHSHLRPGNQAALLSHERTLELYRANAKKTQDPDLQFEFAVFMVDASKTLPIPELTPGNAVEKREDLIKEATSLLKRNADRGHMPSQYFLADCYANGIGTHKNRQDFDRAFPLFILAAKHGHPDAAYRAGTCCENGWGCRRESAKAIQFYRKAAASSHPGALYRLGLAELNGELSMSKRPKEGVKWLKRSAEHATAEFPHALHELALLHERGIHNVVFVDFEYSAELLAQAAELGYAPSAYRLGECYEYGKMGCPQDPALSIHYLRTSHALSLFPFSCFWRDRLTALVQNIAAQQNHRDACFALTAWYLVGSPGVLPQSDTEAFLWAKRAADAGLAKAMYAVGYFYEVSIGTPP
ncbi:HCP-like protein [Lactarius deliciosus]|nr:HCP-like protein [Lactarius deliciosus]